VAERNYVMEAITINRENQTAFEQLKQEKKIIIETKLKSLNMACATLKE
jgi:hypothetical protein